MFVVSLCVCVFVVRLSLCMSGVVCFNAVVYNSLTFGHYKCCMKNLAVISFL